MAGLGQMEKTSTLMPGIMASQTGVSDAVTQITTAKGKVRLFWKHFTDFSFKQKTQNF